MPNMIAAVPWESKHPMLWHLRRCLASGDKVWHFREYVGESKPDNWIFTPEAWILE